MAALIFRLRNVPEDEAEAVRVLLDDNAIEWYETTAGNWGIAMPGIWVSDDDDIVKAKKAIEQFQQHRTATQRQLYKEQQRDGSNVTFIQRVAIHPLRSAGILLFCLFILYVSIHPFLQMVEFSRQ